MKEASKHLFLLFLFFTSFLRADWDQLFSEEEDPSLFHHVNVITGNLNLWVQDAQIEGAKPLSLFRTYTSAGALESWRLNKKLREARGGWLVQGGWNFLPHANLLMEVSLECRDFLIYLAEPGGNLVTYSYSRKERHGLLIFKPTKGFGQSYGTLSAKANIGNNVLELHLDKGEALLLLPNGGSRVYVGQKLHRWGLDMLKKTRKKAEGKLFYRLVREVLPSGHKVCYSYDHKERLVHVALMNPAETKTYAWMHIDLIQKKSPIVFGVRTSDGKSFRYKTTPFKEVDYICDVENSSRAHETIGYTTGRKGISARMQWMRLGGKLQFEASYHLPPNRKKEDKWAERPHKRPVHADKVSSLQADLGPQGEMVTFARFSYEPGKTEVRDSDGLLTRYTHDAGLLTSIAYYNERDQVVSLLKFLWEGERLKAKVMLNGQSQALFSRVFEYDCVGNVIRETLWGSLIGAAAGPFGLNQDGSLAGAEHYSKRYTYLHRFNLPLLEEEDSGLSYRYEYKAGTDLPAAKFTYFEGRILSREFLFYNEDHLLIAEIVDDGDAADPNHLSRVTQRRIKRYDPDPDSGLLRTLTESYWDSASQRETLLKKTGYAYSAEQRVVREDVYDAEGICRYAIHTDYDAQGRVIRKTTPVGQENTWRYDAWGNLLTAKEVSLPQKIFTYDVAGRPASVEECDSLGVIKKTLTFYDAKGNLRRQIDSKGNAIAQAYDPFGRCIRTEFPSALDERAAPYTPTVFFTYDVQGNLSSTAVDCGGTTQTKYNTLRKPVQLIQPDGTSLRHFYSPHGALMQTLYPEGTRIDYLYDPLQRITSKKIYSPENELLSVETWTYDPFQLLSYTDPNGLATHYIYDGAGRKIGERAEDRQISYAYDALGNLEKTLEGEIAHIQIHDPAGRIIEEWEETTGGKIENRMWFSYDEENRKTEALRTTSQGKAVDRFLYDREGRLSEHIDPHGNSAKIFYTDGEINALGQRVLQKRSIDPLGNETLETHDAQDRLVRRERKDPQGHTVSEEKLFYDKAGNRAKRISTVYHACVPKHQLSVEWDHDLMGRVLEEKEGSDKITCFSYDDRGRITRSLLPGGVAIDFVYDGLDRLLERKSSDGTIHDQYAYESGPEPVLVRDLIRHTLLQRTYNAFGELVKETSPYGLTSAWDYDSQGRCTAYTLPDLSSIVYSYRDSHLAEISRLSSQGYLLYTHGYRAFDPNGHLEEEELIHRTGSLHTARDLLERPVHQSCPFLTQSVSYGPSNLVTCIESSLCGDAAYAHDPLGQLIQEGSRSYTFDSLGNPTGCTVNEYNQIIEAPSCLLKYDPNGNPIQRISSAGIAAYTYDALNRLASVTEPSGKITRYVYDAFNRLIAQESDGTQLLYLYDKEQEIGAMDAQGALLQLKIIGLGTQAEVGRAVAIEIAAIAYAPLHDFQGNIIALLSSDLRIAESYRIDAFGREETSSSPVNPWRFCSKRSLSGLVFFGQRFYDPSLGRWLTPDPSGFADGPNLYAYVLNSPLNRLDLFGLDSDPRFFPQEMPRMEVPLHRIISASVMPFSVNLPSRGFISGTPVDWVIYCSHWKKLQFTPQERQLGMVNIADHFQEIIPAKGNMIGLITTINGIRTSRKEFSKNVGSLAHMIPEGTLTIGLRNPTKGIFKDCMRTVQERDGKETPIVVLTRQFMVAMSDMLYKINPNLLWAHFAHSEGGLITRNAIQGMTDDQRARLQEQLHCLGMGSAKPIPSEYGYKIANVYSEKDFITGWFALKYRNNPKYDVRFVRCRSSWSEKTAFLADHAYRGSTYQQEQFEYVGDLRKKWGFHDGKMH